jgi:hypothetical protein
MVISDCGMGNEKPRSSEVEKFRKTEKPKEENRTSEEQNSRGSNCTKFR